MRKFLLCLLIIPSMVRFQRNLVIQEYQIFLDLLRIIMLELLYVILGDGVSFMPFSLYKRLQPEKLIPTDISSQIADKSTTIHVGICEDVPVQMAHNCLVLTDFVVLEITKD